MAEEEIVTVVDGTIAPPSDHKRKLETVAPEPNDLIVSETEDSNVVKENIDEDDAPAAVSDQSEAKRPRLDDKPEDGAVSQNGYKAEEAKEENGVQQPTVETVQIENAEDTQKEDQDTVENEMPVIDNNETCDPEQQPSLENPEMVQTEKTVGDEITKLSDEIPQEEDVSYAGQQPTTDTESILRKMDVPNNKVGVLIGKSGDTIRMLQYNSGAKIQIMRDLDADPYALTRPLELTGSLENVNKAEKLIKDVIAEADAGGSPSLVARGFATAQAPGAVEQVQIQVPNEKVGLIIGRGGETIKGLQTRSGARIQLIPQHLPEGDQSKERTVRVSGGAKEIELARELIKEVMNQNVRPSSLSTGYNQQGHRPRGSSGHSQWGPRGPHPSQSSYNHQHRGPYPSQGSQYPPHTYNDYPPQQQAPRGGYGPNWEQRPSANMQGSQGSGYDYYGGPGGYSSAMPSHGPSPSPAPSMGPPHSQPNYNYGQQPAPYSQTAPPQQSYGHPQAAAQAGYAQQQQYGKPQSYSSPSQGHPPQSYGAPRANQPGEYQGPVPSAQSYGQNVPPHQQQYPYPSVGQMQQSYPTAYGTQQPAADGYNQQPAYAQQGGQPGQGYTQPGGQQGPNYAQGGATAGYVAAYPSSQPGYSEQQAPTNNAVYGGYQGTADPGYPQAQGPAYGAPQNVQQPAYAQAPQAQTGYEQQQVPQSGGYGSVPTPGSAPVVAYGKSVSPNPSYPPQYDATGQMYGAPR